MNTHIKLTAYIFICLIVTTLNVQSQSKVATTAAQFLGIGVGPRAISMGGAFTAASSDVTSIYWNPGALSRSGMSEVMASHTGWHVGTDFNWIGLKIALDQDNAIGLSLTQLAYGDEAVNTVTNPEGTGEIWDAQDMAVTVSYARNLTDRFSIGGSVKYISQRIWNESATAFGFDIGLYFITPFNGLRLGMSISNFGTDMRLDGKDLVQQIDLDPENAGGNKTIVATLKTDSWELPLYFRVGIAYDVLRNEYMTLTTAIDAVRPNDNNEHLNIGAEFGFRNILFVRGGYKALFLEDSEEGLTAGLGLQYPLFGTIGTRIDYSYQDFGRLKEVHSITLGVEF
jgi:hypothetical protein